MLVLLAVAAWLWHPRVLSWGIQKGMAAAVHAAGLRWAEGTVEARAFHPILIHGLELEPDGSLPTASTLRVEKVSITLLSLWRMWEGRFIREIRLDQASGILDFRTGALPYIPMKELPVPEQQAISDTIFAFLPENMELRDANLDILADGQWYGVHHLNTRFSENSVQDATASSVSIIAGPVNRTFENPHAVTAWKHGTLYVAGLEMEPGVWFNQFTANFVRLGGPGLTFDLSGFGGTLRVDVDIDVKGTHQDIDAALVVRSLPIGPLPRFLGMDLQADGLIREGRMTFHGDPMAGMDAEMSLRVHADNVQWMERGWDSLTLGMVYVDRKLTLSELVLEQGPNSARLSGDLRIPATGEDFSTSDYSISLSSDIPDLAKLAALFGEWPLSGRMSLHGSAKGRGPNLDGFLKLEATEIGYYGIPIEAARGNIDFKNGEAQVSELEILSGDDHIRGKGTIQLAAPHTFNGEINASLTNIASYLSRLPTNPLPQIQAGSLNLQWQGDGIPSASSGAYALKLEHVVTPWTPAGLSAEAGGTYSPENVDFRKIEIDSDTLHLSAQATLAASGVSIRGLRLTAKTKPLLTGEIFAPLNPFALASGAPLETAIDPAGKIYAAVKSTEIDLRELGELFGQNLPIEGKAALQLDAMGTAESPQLQAQLTGKELRALETGVDILPATLELGLSIKEGMAKAEGKYATPGFDPIVLRARAPLSSPGEGILGWINPNAPIEAIAEFPRTELQTFRPFLPKMRKLDGVLSGSVKLTETLSNPKVQGVLELHKGAIEMGLREPPITDLEARLTFDTTTVKIEKFTGAIGAGPFSIEGSARFDGPDLDLTIRGDKVLLARDPRLRLRANVNLRAKGKGASGTLSGAVRLVEGRIYQRLEILPLMIPSAVQHSEMDALPQVDGLVPEPFAGWKLDFTVTNETPFLMAGNIAQGEIIPELRIGGTAGNPIPAGTITLKKIQAFLPFSTMDIAEGHIYFSAKNPMMPILDIRGTVEAQNYDVTAYAYGPLNDRKLVLRADPPLAQESIVLLLTAGIVPSGTLAGEGFGQVAIGQGGMLLLRALTRQFDLQGARMDSIINRMQMAVVPSDDPRERPGLRSDFRVGKGFSATVVRDGLSFYNAGITYSYRFR